MADDPELDVLLHESTQLHQSIERLSGRILGLFGVVLPGAVVLFGFLARDSPEEASSPIASVALVGVVALVVVYAGSLWAELLTYIEYKYDVLYPALYSRAGRNAENMMHYLSRRPALAPAATFVTLIFVLTFGLAAYGVYSTPGNWSNAWFAAVAALFVFPLVST